jgi:hypothetical protein
VHAIADDNMKNIVNAAYVDVNKFLLAIIRQANIKINGHSKQIIKALLISN